MYKYLNWADKKLHTVFFKESKDQITEDLLDDFREGDDSAKTVYTNKSQQHKANNQANMVNKPAGMVQDNNGLMSRQDFILGNSHGNAKKVISV